jgi:hypothetical protein
MHVPIFRGEIWNIMISKMYFQIAHKKYGLFNIHVLNMAKCKQKLYLSGGCTNGSCTTILWTCLYVWTSKQKAGRRLQGSHNQLRYVVLTCILNQIKHMLINLSIGEPW